MDEVLAAADRVEADQDRYWFADEKRQPLAERWRGADQRIAAEARRRREICRTCRFYRGAVADDAVRCGLHACKCPLSLRGGVCQVEKW
ncbi:MAG: hypothetical protein ACOCTI_04380 [Phycisphaeraceae bacterium]